MKRILILSVIVSAIGVSTLFGGTGTGSATAVQAYAAGSPQIDQILRRQIRRRNNRNGGGDNNNNVRYETRIVHKGRKVYRDTYRITYKRNGGEKVKRVSRVRIA